MKRCILQLVPWATGDFKPVDMEALACYLWVTSETTMNEAGTEYYFFGIHL